MSDVTIKYNGSQIAELNGTGSKTLQTSGKYCEGDIAVEYAPRSKTYEITLTKASGWVLLTALDDEVINHINDAALEVSLVAVTPYAYEFGTVGLAIVSNNPYGYNGSYPIYGMSSRMNSETSGGSYMIYYPPNKTDTSTGIGGEGMFRRSGKNYYFRPGGYYVRTGTYRLTFRW